MTESTVIKANGNFVSGDYPTSGKVSIQTGEDGKKYLSFVNFKTDNGPDLRIYLSSNTSAADFVEAGKLKSISGNFFYELSSSVEYKAKNHVLIGCEEFDVLFGYAILETQEGEYFRFRLVVFIVLINHCSLAWLMSAIIIVY